MLRKSIPLFIAFVLIGLAASLGLASSSLAGIPARETPLNPAGLAYEINPDSQGILWISDYAAGEIRGVNPSNGSYTVFPVVGGPSDARSDGAGNVWWAYYNVNQVGRLSTTNGSASLWEIPGSGGLYGTALDGSGGLWVTDSNLPYLYHLDAASTLCTYTLPTGGLSDYLVSTTGQVWLSDYLNGQILRLFPGNHQFTWWTLPAGSRPTGLALDSQGSLWWADTVRGRLGQLIPASNHVITYTQTLVQNPEMIALDDGRVWFTNQTTLGVLDPDQAPGQGADLPPSSQVAPPDCAPLAPSSTSTFTPTLGQGSWTNVVYPTLSSQGGWQIFQLPAGGFAWGIAALEDIWLVDNGRQVLAKVPKQTESLIYLPVILR